MPENTNKATTEPQHRPDGLNVPDGNVLLLQVYGKRGQIYDCPLVDPPKATPHAIFLFEQANKSQMS
jgi:hypothetical protein